MRSKLHKGINIWSFDQSRSIEQCMRLAKDAGFEGIELAMAKDGPLGLTSSDQEILAVKALAQEIGIQICSLATGLYWQYSLTANPPEIRAKAKQVVRRQIDMAALLGVDCILVCPGTVGVDFRPEDVVPDANDVTFFAGSEIIDYDVAYQRSQEALKELAPYAQEKGSSSVLRISGTSSCSAPWSSEPSWMKSALTMWAPFWTWEIWSFTAIRSTGSRF